MRCNDKSLAVNWNCAAKPFRYNTDRLYVLSRFLLLIPPEERRARVKVLAAIHALVSDESLTEGVTLATYSPIRLQPFVQRGEKNNTDHRTDQSLRIINGPATEKNSFREAAVEWHLQCAMNERLRAESQYKREAQTTTCVTGTYAVHLVLVCRRQVASRKSTFTIVRNVAWSIYRRACLYRISDNISYTYAVILRTHTKRSETVMFIGSA